jgi:aminobenzoyl-glutamate transport protein
LKTSKVEHLKRGFSYLVCLLVLAELLLVLTSWLLSATMAEGVRSLISSEGVRWFFGSFSTLLSTEWLVWLLLLAMTGGCLWQSGLLHPQDGYRQGVALRAAVVLLVIYVIAVLALTAVPHAVLLSATGQLMPSPFSRALVPIVSFGALLVSAVFGYASGRFSSVSDVVDALSFGIGKSAPLFLLYILAVQLYESLRFVFF